METHNRYETDHRHKTRQPDQIISMAATKRDMHRERYTNSGHAIAHDRKRQLPESFLSSRIRRRPRSPCDRTDPGTGVASNRSRASQKSPAGARTAGRWRILLDDFRKDSVKINQWNNMLIWTHLYK